MVKILSRSGDSLADAYDVEGSIAGIDQLLSREVTLVHDMGGVLFSERLSGRINRGVSGALSQDDDFDVVFSNLVESSGIGRVIGLTVFADVVARVGNVSLNLIDPIDGRETPLFAWDSNEGSVTTRLSDNGGAAANVDVLVPADLGGTRPPITILGSDQPRPMDSIAFRGLANSFGAGTVNLTALILVVDPRVEGLSSRGLPIPGW